jgi:hypothetical protein
MKQEIITLVLDLSVHFALMAAILFVGIGFLGRKKGAR